MNLCRNIAVVVVALGSTSVAQADLSTVSTIAIEASAGRTWHDFDGNGVFESAGGDVPTTSSYVFWADTRLDEFQDVIRVGRSGLEFDLDPLSDLRDPGSQILSATLSMHFFSSRDVVNFPPPDFGPPTGLLHGYSGDGVISANDMLVDSFLTDFLAPKDTTIVIDVTQFIRRLAILDRPFASFMLQLKNDYERGNNASSYYGSRHLNELAFRPILSINFVQVSNSVTIDIKPDSEFNCFNINGHGVIPVAVLSSTSFDAADIDVTTLSFGGLDVRVRGNKEPLCSLEDVNDDFLNDLVCQFQDNPEYWDVGNDEATLTGALFDGIEIEGTDSICIVP
jgi:hypothetical protein